MNRYSIAILLAITVLAPAAAFAEQVGCVTTEWKLIGANHKVCVESFNDPKVPGVTCHVSQARTGGLKGSFGMAEDPSEFSLACRQVGPIKFKRQVAQGDEMFRERRSLFFKKMQIVRGCDAKRNVLIYMVYTDKLIDGSPQNSTSSVPIMPWGTSGDVPKCSEWVR